VTESNKLFQNTWHELHFSELKMQLTRNARDKKNRSLPCMFPFVFIICLSREQFRKKTIVKKCTSATFGFEFGFFTFPLKCTWMPYIEIHPDGTQKTAPSTHILLGKFACVLFCVK